MITIISLLLNLTLLILVTKIAAELLAHTGLARETARFQARSAFTGVGFTTSESEKMDFTARYTHPVRQSLYFEEARSARQRDGSVSGITNRL